MTSKDQYNVAVVGATGNIGREMLNILAERHFPICHITALASRHSVGKEVSFGEGPALKVQAVNDFSFEGVDIVFASAGGEVSKTYADRATAAGALYIDNSSYYRMHDDVPLVVPEVNPEAAKAWKKRGIIANPNCSTIQLVVALKAIHDRFGLTNVRVATYQSVSGAGKPAMDELYGQTRRLFFAETPEPKVFDKQIAFNVLPKIDVGMDDGRYREEWKMQVESQKILSTAFDIEVICARVPVFVGHSIAVFVTCQEPVDLSLLREDWRKDPAITYMDDAGRDIYPTPKDCAGEDSVFCSRLVKHLSGERGLQFWCVADNLRKGGALNAVQIGELMHKQGWLTS